MKTKLSKTESDEPFERSNICCVSQAVTALPFHGSIIGSIPIRNTIN
jgi:hypothetical protein